MEPSDPLETALFVLWIVISVALAFKARKPQHVYWPSVILAGGPLIYSNYLHGIPEMGGIIHLFVSGLHPLILFYMLRYYRKRKIELKQNSVDLRHRFSGGSHRPHPRASHQALWIKAKNS